MSTFTLMETDTCHGDLHQEGQALVTLSDWKTKTNLCVNRSKMQECVYIRKECRNFLELTKQRVSHGKSKKKLNVPSQ